MRPSQKAISTTENPSIITLESELELTGPDHESQYHESQSADSVEQIRERRKHPKPDVGEPISSRPPYSSANDRCTREMQIDPSPTAEATRFTFPARTSPTANTPGRLASGIWR